MKESCDNKTLGFYIYKLCLCVVNIFNWIIEHAHKSPIEEVFSTLELEEENREEKWGPIRKVGRS